MASTLRNAVIAAALAATMLDPAKGWADQPGGAASADLPPLDLSQLSPEARAALLKQVQSANPNMTPEQAETSFNSLPPDVQAQLRAKWDSLTDDQKAALKKLRPEAVKEMVIHQLKQMMAPIQGAVAKVKAFVHKMID